MSCPSGGVKCNGGYVLAEFLILICARRAFDIPCRGLSKGEAKRRRIDIPRSTLPVEGTDRVTSPCGMLAASKPAPLFTEQIGDEIVL